MATNHSMKAVFFHVVHTLFPSCRPKSKTEIEDATPCDCRYLYGRPKTKKKTRKARSRQKYNHMGLTEEVWAIRCHWHASNGPVTSMPISPSHGRDAAVPMKCHTPWRSRSKSKKQRQKELRRKCKGAAHAFNHARLVTAASNPTWGGCFRGSGTVAVGRNDGPTVDWAHSRGPNNNN